MTCWPLLYYHLAERTYQLTEASHSAVLSGLDLLPIGFLVLDQHGKILISNDAAKRVIGAGRMIAAIDDVLVLESKSHRKLFRELIVHSDGRKAGGLLVPREAQKPLVILVVPIAHNGKAGNPASLVFLSDPEVPCVVDSELLGRLFGFTPAEARVAALVMGGKSVEDVAGALGITSHTARNHLKRLFAKTRTKKQGELVHALLSSPAFLCLKIGHETKTESRAR